MRNQEVVSYLNAIDLSLAEDSSIVSNIYSEILPHSYSLATDPFASASLERLIMVSKPQHLLGFLNSLGSKIVHKKLGSRTVECIFKRLFECIYTNGEFFYLQDALDSMDPGTWITCHNATHVLRQGLMLLSGKRIDKLDVRKYTIPDAPEPKDTHVSGTEDGHDAGKERNAAYSARKLKEYKEILRNKMEQLEANDSLTTLGMFLQIVKSQSMIAQLIEKDCDAESIKNRGFLYEMIPTIASTRNLELLYSKISSDVMDLCQNERSSYFMRSLLRHSRLGSQILGQLCLDDFDAQSNVILGLLESLQNAGDHCGIERLIRGFYDIRKSLFREFLLERHDRIDTKFVGAVVAFMAMPKEHNYGVNEDFVRCFRREWVRTKAGISLVRGFVDGSADPNAKRDFFNRNIDAFWGSSRWKDGRSFAKKIIAYTDGHSRKKAYEILEECGHHANP